MSTVYNFYRELIKLKKLARTGWKYMSDDLKHYESVAEHVFSTCALAYSIMVDKKLELNTEKVLKMLLFHEMGEVEAGDLTPWDNVGKDEKYRREQVVVEKISAKAQLPEILELWLEFKEKQTPEAVFCWEMDMLDKLIQAQYYAFELGDPEFYIEFYSNERGIADKYKEYLM